MDADNAQISSNTETDAGNENAQTKTQTAGSKSDKSRNKLALRASVPTVRVSGTLVQVGSRRHSYTTMHHPSLEDSLAFNTENWAQREYSHPVKVELKATFMKIMDIDTLSQQFEAEIFIQAKWEELFFIGKTPAELEELLPCELWDPELIVSNTAGEFDSERRSYIVRYEEGYEAPVVFLRWRFKGLFRENLELEHFPFDVQEIGLRLSTERSIDEINMVHDPWHLSSVNTKLFHDSQEWSIYKHVEVVQDRTTLEYASSTIHPILLFNCRVKRRVGYFLWNIIFTVSLILILSFTTVSIDPTTSDRLASTITLFLTLVAFKLVVKQSLPTISYLTYLDTYVVGSLIYLVLYSIENSVVAWLAMTTDRELIFLYDQLGIVSLAVLLILFHLLFIVHIQITALRRRRLMSDMDKQYEERAFQLMQINKEKDQKKVQPKKM